MLRLVLLLSVVLLLGILLFLNLSNLVSWLSEWEIKGFLTRTATREKIPLNIMKMRMSEGVKYLPNATQHQLAEDSDVYNHFIYEQDKSGRTVRNKCYNIGPDNTIVTTDEYLKYYLAYEYDKAGRVTREIRYDAKGADNKWFTPDDVEGYSSVYEHDSKGNKLRFTRYALDGGILQYVKYETNPQGLITREVIYKAKGPDNVWFSEDDEIEKYHYFWYDYSGSLLRIAEYHAQLNGRGPDGVWFSPDDVISSTKVFSYCEDGYLAKISKYIDPGADKIWFTDDDIAQYYTVYDYTDHLNHKAK